MSSINPHYTLNYSQPEDYRFSHDSVFLARRVHEIYSEMRLASWRALDLCAGTGIIGMDLLFHRREAGLDLPANFDFLDVQDVYWDHFLENRGRLGEVQSELQFLNLNYEKLVLPNYKNKYDLIVCNPPYFAEGSGKMSPSEFKNRCRFFLDSDLDKLLFSIHNTLRSSGSCYILLREIPRALPGNLRYEVLPDVRGTYFLRLFKRD